MKVILQGNITENCNVILQAHDEDLITAHFGNDGQILLDVTIYDCNGDKIAKLHNNSWVFNKEMYTFTTNPNSGLKLMDSQGKIIIEVQVVDSNTIEVTNINIYTKKGVSIRTATCEVLGETYKGIYVGTSFLSNNTISGNVAIKIN